MLSPFHLTDASLSEFQFLFTWETFHQRFRRVYFQSSLLAEVMESAESNLAFDDLGIWKVG